jgi:tripartite ATP-independent transporter DctP family solute receptor
MTRRRFTAVVATAGGMLLAGRRARAAEFEMRHYHSQNLQSSLHKRLSEMWQAVETETGGRVHVEIFPEYNQLPGNSAEAIAMVLRDELEFVCVMGGVMGNLTPAAEIQQVPFAFRSQEQVYAALDGDLGDYLRRELTARNVYALPRGCFENGFRHISCATRPIRTAADLQGLKMRVPNSEIAQDFFRSLGAAPIVVNSNRMYEGLKAGTVEAQENPLSIMEEFRLYEVQKYVSLTRHMWSGFNMLANLERWRRLPSTVQEAIERNVARYSRIQRAENQEINAGLQPRLVQRGMVFNEADVDSLRAPLADFYTRWRAKVGQRTWSLLEGHVGKIG